MATTRLGFVGPAAAYLPFVAKADPNAFTGTSIQVSGFLSAALTVNGHESAGLQVSGIAGGSLTISGIGSV